MLDNTGKTLADRLMSSFPLSLPTGLAFESVFKPRTERYDDQRQIPNQIQISNYDEIWINVLTLFRNLVSSVDKMVFLSSSPLELKEIIDFEIDVINDLLANEGQDLCKAQYYIPDYDHLKKHIRLREPKTEGQRFYNDQLEKVIALLKKSTDIFQDKIHPRSKTKALILTHVPYDLLSYKHFTKLDLLESNTGKLKSRNEWNSKYYQVGDNDLSHLPFNSKLLYIFGDRVLIRPSDYKLRKLIYDISINRNWIVTTTIDKIIFDCELEIREPFVLDFVKKL